MKVTLESTSKVVTLVKDGVEMPARIWEGETENGIPCHAFITRIAAREDHDRTEFERDLEDCRQPSKAVEAYDMRLIV